MKAAVTVVALLAGALEAQISTPRPPGRGTSQQQNSSVKLVDQTGEVHEVKGGSISIELSDSRLLTFKINSSTKLNDGLSLSKLEPGDRIRIQGTQDLESFLTAATISRDTTVGVSKVENAPAASNPPQVGSIGRKPPVDPDDGGPPVLRRGKPAPRKPSGADVSDNAEIVASPPLILDSKPPDSSLKGARPTDASYEAPEVVKRNIDAKVELIERARDWAMSFTGNLPNYVCQQFTTRYQRILGRRDWQALDIVSANVVYENGKEDYRNLAINGKPINKRMEDMPGSWSTGEFGTTLRSLFHPGRKAEFAYVKQSQMNGVTTMVYDYKVKREYSDWRIQLGSQSIIPAYTGRVWIDSKTAGVMRIEMSAAEIPAEFPLDQVEASNDYGLVRLATADQFLLPTHAETLSCERGSPICSRNTIEFRNYHKYTGDAVLVFDK